MKGLKPINRDERLAYIDLFHQERDLAIDSPFHYLLFDEELSPVLQAITLDEILSLHPTDAPIHQQVWCCSDVVNFARRKQLLWQPSEQLPRRWGVRAVASGHRCSSSEAGIVCLNRRFHCSPPTVQKSSRLTTCIYVAIETCAT